MKKVYFNLSLGHLKTMNSLGAYSRGKLAFNSITQSCMVYLAAISQVVHGATTRNLYCE